MLFRIKGTKHILLQIIATCFYEFLLSGKYRWIFLRCIGISAWKIEHLKVNKDTYCSLKYLNTFTPQVFLFEICIHWDVYEATCVSVRHLEARHVHANVGEWKKDRSIDRQTDGKRRRQQRNKGNMWKINKVGQLFISWIIQVAAEVKLQTHQKLNL